MIFERAILWEDLTVSLGPIRAFMHQAVGPLVRIVTCSVGYIVHVGWKPCNAVTSRFFVHITTKESVDDSSCVFRN